MKPRNTTSRGSLTSKPGVVFPQPQTKAPPKPPAKGQLPYPTGAVSAKKALLEKQVNSNAPAQKELPYPTTPGKKQASPKNTNAFSITPKTPPYPTSIVFPKGQPSPKAGTGPVAAATAKLQARTPAYPTKDPLPQTPKMYAEKAKDVPLVELSPNKQAITKQFATEIEKAFNRAPSPEKKPKGSAPKSTMPKMQAPLRTEQPAYRSTRPLPLVPQRPAPVPMAIRSPLMGPRSPATTNTFDDMIQQFSSSGVSVSGSRSPSIAPSMASSRPSPQIYQDMFEDALDDDTSASYYDLTKPLRTNTTKRPLNTRSQNTSEQLPVLPFRSGKQNPTTTPLVIQKEPSRLRISSLITPRPANPLLAVPTLDKRTVSAPMPQPVPLTSPVLVDKDFEPPSSRPGPLRMRSTFRHEFFRAGSLKESKVDNPKVNENAAPHPLQQRMNSMKEAEPIRRKWSSRIRKESIPPTSVPNLIK